MKTILVVGDERMIVHLIGRVLANCGYQTLIAENSADAFSLAEVEKGEVDLLITDCSLQSESGRDLADRLWPAHPQMKVLQISGYPGEFLAWAGEKMFKRSFLQKPFTAPALVHKVQTCLEH